MVRTAQGSFRQFNYYQMSPFNFILGLWRTKNCGIENKNCNTQLINGNDFVLQLKDWPPHSKKRMPSKVIKN